MYRMLTLLVLLTVLVGAERPDGVFATSIQAGDIDASGVVEYLDGVVQPSAAFATGDPRVIWGDRPTSHAMLTFGRERSLGERHLRIPFTREVAIGSLLVMGNCRVSVLRADVDGPGDLADDSQWLAAERLDGRSVTSDQPGARSQHCWVLPPGTVTKALRFSHEPAATDRNQFGEIGGIYILAGRYANVAPQAQVHVSDGQRQAAVLTNQRADGWGFWQNNPLDDDPPISADNQQWVILDFPAPVSLRGLNAMAGCASAVEVDLLDGGYRGLLAEASAGNWRQHGRYEGLRDWYPAQLKPGFVDFAGDQSARALRLRMVAPINTKGLHGHLKNKHLDGRRIWMDELMALVDLGDRPLSAAVLPAWPSAEIHPPIEIPFTMPEDGRVSIVIDDADGNRVRNLIADTSFTKGEHRVWWDGLDDLGRDKDAPAHGLYHVPGSLVQPGSYTVRAIATPELKMTYELSIDQAGNPPWKTKDNRGGWGTNHTPPSCTAFLPAGRAANGKAMVFIGSYIAEGGHGLFWIDMNGDKQGGVHWLGGHWTGAQTVCVDSKTDVDDELVAFVVSGFGGEIRFVGLDRSMKEQVLYKQQLVEKDPKDSKKLLGPDVSNAADSAAYDGLLVASMYQLGELWLVDSRSKRLLAKIALDDPRALAFAPDGELFVCSGTRLVALTLPMDEIAALRAADAAAKPATLTATSQRVVVDGLDEPRGLCRDADGAWYIAEQGDRHQVRVFSVDGRLLRTVGKPGRPAIGPYDELHMNNPKGITIDEQGRLWVCEDWTQPKRVSLWSAEGELLRAWYGPSRYGGGGVLSPFDRNRFYNFGMEFAIDWQTGVVSVERVLLLAKDKDRQFPPASHSGKGLPEWPHLIAGKRYFSNWNNSSPTNANDIATIWADDGERLTPVAAIGNPYRWDLLKSEAYASLWPQEVQEQGLKEQYRPCWFAWQDTDGDGLMIPDEVMISAGKPGGVTVLEDGSFTLPLAEDLVRFAADPSGGRLRYDFNRPEILWAGGRQGPASSGGNWVLPMADGWCFAYPPSQPFSNMSLGAARNGQARWSYPNLWPGLHASHRAPPPSFPGMVIGPTRLIGHGITPRGSDVGELIFINANPGCIYVFTADGIFVNQLFHDARSAPHWQMPIAERGMRVDGLSLSDETFWPTVSQLRDDGSIWLCVGPGSVSSLVKVHGYERIKRLPDQSLQISAADLATCLAYQQEQEALRRSRLAAHELRLPIAAAPTVDGDLGDWQGADWATIDERGVKAYFNANSKPYDVKGSVRVAGDRLYAAWRTTEKRLLENSGEQATAAFKTGGCLDLMLGCDPAAKPGRKDPVAGDCRLLITRKKDDQGKWQTWATLYKAVVPGTAVDAKVPFSSPWRTITFDAVIDVSDQVELAQQEGDYEVSIPVSVLGLQPKAGMQISGDIGILRGNGVDTTQRIYWSNKATNITADVPSEAMLQPAFWGRFLVE